MFHFYIKKKDIVKAVLASKAIKKHSIDIKHHYDVKYLSDLVTQMASEYNLPLKVMCNTSRGYYIQMYCGGKDGYSADNLPGVFIKVNKFKSTLSFTTTDIVSTVANWHCLVIGIQENPSSACGWLNVFPQIHVSIFAPHNKWQEWVTFS